MTIASMDEQETIHTAVKRGDFVALKGMISSGASVNEVDKHSFTPLHWATNVGAIEVTDDLVLNKHLISPLRFYNIYCGKMLILHW